MEAGRAGGAGGVRTSRDATSTTGVPQAAGAGKVMHLKGFAVRTSPRHLHVENKALSLQRPKIPKTEVERSTRFGSASHGAFRQIQKVLQPGKQGTEAWSRAMYRADWIGARRRGSA